MFNNIGKKIKTLAEIITVLGILASIVTAIVIWTTVEYSFLIGLGILVFGCIFAWIGSFLLYGFGELIESTKRIEQTICPQTPGASNKPANVSFYNADDLSYEIADPAPQQYSSTTANPTIMWKCPKCHTPYMKDVKRCDVCGEVNIGYHK